MGDALMRTVNICLAVLLLLAAPARAAELVSASDIPSVTSALAEAGYGAELRQDDDGVRYLLVNEGPQEFSISFGDCEDVVAAKGCKLLIFDASWDADSGLDVETANRFNRNSTLAHAFVDEDGSFVLTLIVNTSGGLTPENFAAVLAEWQSADAGLSALIGDEPPPAGVVVAALTVR
jgi:hypothetical protein